MIINNDVVTFQAADFSALSAFAVSAIQYKFGSTSVLLTQFSGLVNNLIKSAKNSYVDANAGNNADVALLIRKFAAADAPTLAAAADEIAALSSALGPTPP
jgi:hypothetical protein